MYRWLSVRRVLIQYVLVRKRLEGASIVPFYRKFTSIALVLNNLLLPGIEEDSSEYSIAMFDAFVRRAALREKKKDDWPEDEYLPNLACYRSRDRQIEREGEEKRRETRSTYPHVNY
jgi:hypothetical protein